ncbi:2-dehydro-3-deoxygluconokinase [Nocardioides dokdonensis FR1436]|uniref:2-dehydro-3-deoxygluconokinase n=2 Tax=Nocardioides TaxID=1839 RepID=A0A1A9GH08_9ACTN|nr:2-dehydro-3-deoxygluconokinase [Nocardioides dokdonensis FR1436]
MVVGEALVDVVRTADGAVGEHAGGSAANVAVALARLGRPVRFATAYADDERGALLARHLAGAGVRLASDPHVVRRTSTAEATIGTDGGASYVFDLDWRLGEVPQDPTPLALHVCSLGAVVAPGAEAVVRLVEALRARTTITYDVNMRPAVTGAGPEVVEQVERLVALADLVKVSDEDLEVLLPMLGVEDAARRLLSLGPRAVVLTRGAEGATWWSEAGAVDVSPRAVEVADTIGAGDTFAAALVDGLWHLDLLGGRLPTLSEASVHGLLDHASRAAAVTVSRPGADPPYRSELG